MNSFLEIAYAYGPLGLLVLLIACSFGLPLSKVLLIISGGYLAGSGRSSPFLSFIAVCLGLHLGELAIFCIGRRWGTHLIATSWLSRLFPSNRIAKAQALVAKHGTGTILLARVTPVIRSACYLSLGSLGMSFHLFNSLNMLISSVYCAFFFFIGFRIAQSPELLSSWAVAGNLWAIVAGLFCFLVLLLARKRLKPQPAIETNLIAATSETNREPV